MKEYECVSSSDKTMGKNITTLKQIPEYPQCFFIFDFLLWNLFYTLDGDGTVKIYVCKLDSTIPVGETTRVFQLF